MNSVTAVPARTPALSSHASATAQAIPAGVPAGGKDVVATGQDLPSRRITPPPTADVESIVRRLNELMAERQRNLSFRVDESSGRTVITVLDAATKQIVRQIPSEEVLALARAIEESIPLVDDRT